MVERFIHSARIERPPAAETAAEARLRLADRWPRGAVRRMTHLGLLTGAALDGLTLTPADAVVYASRYGETRALEDFLRSFPAPSPLLFQTSIHPGAVQQVLIGRQQSVGAFWPLAGRERLVEHALLTALLEPAARVLLIGGEERGTWLLDVGVASDRAFAFALELTRGIAGSIGRVRFVPGPEADEPCIPLERWADALAARSPLAWHGAGGRWELSWS